MAEPALAIQQPVRRIGRYALHEEIASGGMATVYLGRLVGQTGFSRPVAIKRLHDNLATDPKFVSMLLDEARLAARIRHPNVVATLDVVEAEREIVVVMEYVHGESLAMLRKMASDRGERIPPRIAATIMAGALHGLHAAHEAVDEQGEPLHVVHRDVSPQNVLVGVDGIPRVLDFGIAKAAGRMQTTQDGKLKGKFGYMAPEQLKGTDVTGQADVYAAAVVLWETLTGQRLYPEDADAATILTQILFTEVKPPSSLAPGLPAGADEVVMKGLAKEPEARYATALEMAVAVERAFGVASPTEVGAFVKDIARDDIKKKAESLAIVERADTDAGQKRRREVVARVAAGGVEGEAKSRVLPMALAFVLVAFAGGFGIAKFVRGKSADVPVIPPASSTVETTADKPVVPTATESVTPPPPVSASATASAETAPPPSASAAPAASVTKAGRRHGGPPASSVKKGEPKTPDATSVASATTTTTTPPSAPTKTPEPAASSDEGRDLIPKFRK